MTVLRSRDNAQVKRWAKLARESRLRRAEGRALIEGPHLLHAFLSRNLRPAAVLATEAAMADAEIASLVEKSGVAPVLLSPTAFKAVADTETPQGVAAEIAVPSIRREGAWVFLEAVQDAGNVGAIVRSAAAFGAGAVILDRACADPWSPKVLRAGMGGHFALQVLQVDSLAPALESFPGRLLCTVARGGEPLRRAELSGKIGWIFGSEARGVSMEVRQRASKLVTVALCEGTESLNVAAAAAVCLYEAFSRPGGKS
ncbi:MAG TPA: RNA methyltransferase [Burkholderiales bacterium]|nr:RNA methyltransferase [Burkholderiales bacterium]